MSDSLVLKGVKDVRKHTGTEMLRRSPKGGGDTFQLKRWWVAGGVSTCYEDATVFDVTTGVGTVKLAVASSMSTDLRIIHDGSFNFTFIGANEVGRAALFTENMELIEHYVFPAISGGKIMTVTPPGSANRPTPAPAKTLTAVTLGGADEADDGDTESYTASKTGTATDVNYVLTSSVPEDVVSTLDVTFVGTGERTLTLTGTSLQASSNKADTLTVTVS